MREDCCHYQTRTYEDDGEVARFCTLGLAPEAPWRCPPECGSYERIVMISADLEHGSLHTPPVEDEPDDPPDEIVALLADAETIVGAAEAEVLADLRPQRKKRWWQRKRPGDDEGFHLSNR